MTLGTVALVSLEVWDEVWRRNQHLAHELLGQGLCDRIVFVEPPRRGGTRRTWPQPGVRAVRPGLLAPRRLGGLALTAAALRARDLRGVDVLWVNDAQLGVHLLRRGLPTVYDVTDDWRASSQVPRVRARQIVAEDTLAERARTVVCSAVLQQTWASRYAVDAVVVANGADVAAIAAASRHPLPGRAPHVVYVGTLHRDRLDLDLLHAVALGETVGTVHLVGPDLLDEQARAQLAGRPSVLIHGPVPAAAVPGWLASADVLIAPHVVNGFTLSLDAIKAYEYLATDRPVVATPTSGFQALTRIDGVDVVPATTFPAALHRAMAAGRREPVTVPSWSDQARRFAAELATAGG